MSFKALAEKIFKLFDKTGDGRVSLKAKRQYT
jgi:hypothetical protein